MTRPAAPVRFRRSLPLNVPAESSQSTNDPGWVDGANGEGDAVLLVRAERGSRGALAALYERYGGATFCAAATVCGSQQAGEIVTRVFVDLGQGPDETFDVDMLGDCLRSKAHRMAVAVVREARSAGCIDVGHVMPDGMPTAAMQSLPRLERDVLVRAYLGDTYREIAAALHKSEAAVLHLIRAALEHLGAHRSQPASTT